MRKLSDNDECFLDGHAPDETSWACGRCGTSLDHSPVDGPELTLVDVRYRLAQIQQRQVQKALNDFLTDALNSWSGDSLVTVQEANSLLEHFANEYAELVKDEPLPHILVMPGVRLVDGEVETAK